MNQQLTTSALVVELGRGDIEVSVDVFWSSHEPLLVSATFSSPRMAEAVSWGLSRDTLMEAFTRPGRYAGQGDCLVKADSNDLVDNLYVTLSSPDGCSTLAIRQASKVRHLLVDSFLAVPRGEEGDFMDLDRVIQRLLLGERS